MDLLDVIKQRLEEQNLGQKDLAVAARVTESYVSQLLNRKKSPPAPDRTDIYSRMEKSLRLPKGRLATLAELQLREEVQRRVLDPPAPLFKEVRKLIVRKCAPGNRDELRAIFEKQPFGEIERLVTQKLLDVVKSLAREELDNEDWLRRFAEIRERSYEAVRVDILEFLDTDVFHVSDENCVAFLEPFIEAWNIDLVTFGMEVRLNRRLGPAPPWRFEFKDVHAERHIRPGSGLQEFLSDSSLSGDVTEEELAFLKRIEFGSLVPTAMYFYREVQSLRDSLHFRASPSEKRSKAERKQARKRSATRRPPRGKDSSRT